MPINIYIEATGEKVDSLCDHVWDLPSQIETLENWLETKGKELRPNKYVADIGFSIRKDACGGGAVLNSNSLKIMGELGMDIYLSEYPNLKNE